MAIVSANGAATPLSPNVIINGAFDIWQRGTSVSYGTVLGFGPDRTNLVRSGWAGGATISRQSSQLEGFQYCARVQRNNGTTDTSYIGIAQSIETANSIPLAGKTVTFSFYARKGANFSSSTSSLSFDLQTGTGTDGNLLVPFAGQVTAISQTFTLTSSWQRFTATAFIPGTVTQLGYYIQYVPSGTAGANDYYEITGVQLEAGSVATPFRRNANSIQGELAACQRYFRRLGNKQGQTRISVGWASSSTAAIWIINHPIEMRIAPIGTVTGPSPIWYDAVGGNTFASFTVSGSSSQTAELIGAGTSGLTTGRAVGLTFDSQSTYIDFNAEL